MREIVITLSPEQIDETRFHAAREDVARSGHPALDPDTCIQWLTEGMAFLSDLFWEHGLEHEEGHVIDLVKGVVYVDKQD